MSLNAYVPVPGMIWNDEFFEWKKRAPSLRHDDWMVRLEQNHSNAW